jgi:hypothetical protein
MTVADSVSKGRKYIGAAGKDKDGLYIFFKSSN